MKKPDYILSLPEMSICFEKNRRKRCKHEPKCQHVNCLRNALEHFLDQVVSGKVSYRALKSKNGYDTGFIKDEYFCNANKCECAQIDQAIIGKLEFLSQAKAKNLFRRHCSI